MLHLRFRQWTQGASVAATAPRSVGPLRNRAWTQGSASTPETAPRSIGPLRFRAWTQGSASTPATAPRCIGPLRFRAWTHGAAGAPESTSGGVWRWLNGRTDEEDEALEAVQVVAERQAEALSRPSQSGTRFDPAESVNQLAAELEARGVAWDKRYLDLLALARAWMLAKRAELEQELVGLAAEWARLEQLEALRRQRNDNAMRVLLLMTMQ